ncbi:hypothetical protein K2173_023253 [Erythroxylum novogranatense]|uniref:ADP-ribosyl cyclase/cyclic ADP-ribose hydrolase n=1 Tax=Erythroxylum novogranatense TaxID=1862640 RepID=A0AAV8T8V2_9ROSI|nr:hypothetical protein K2173_023253 [Erythroxylum novogranatense]
MNTQNATSTPSSSCWSYDVFLSFRCEDTRNNFVDHLYSALHQRGILISRDDLGLKRGTAIAPGMFKAIQESRLSIVVFSRTYASSTWCLDELVKIVELKNSTRQIVIPVFYGVAPSEVRSQTGAYKEAFDKHGKVFKYLTEKVQKWRDALAEVANLSGWDTKDRKESEVIKEMVEIISNRLSHMMSPTIDEDLVGMNLRLEEFNSYMCLGVDDVRFVGICGMAGIGKTTIARAYYNWTSHQFEGSTFLANVREVAQKGGLSTLQEQILCEILMESNIKIWNVYKGVEMIRTRLRHKRILVVIDDVDHLKQMQSLAGKIDWFGPGSRVIITTRDESLLVRHGVHRIYMVKGLKDFEAHQLFRLKAFGEDHTPKEYTDLSKIVVNYADGVPLALEVLGSFLYGKSLREWRSAIDRLKENPEKEIFNTLKISFDGLEETEKKLFLDIACFFKGEDKDWTTMIWDSCGFFPDIGIRALIDKSLITISNNKLRMHDLLQEMGRKIVRQESQEPGKRSRLWLYKDIFHVFTRSTGTEDVEGILLDSLRNDEIQSTKTFEYLSNELRLLKWHGYPFKHLPSSFESDELVELNLCYSQVEQLWKGIKKLTVINLSHSKNLVMMPDLRGVPSLVKLILEGCSTLSVIDNSIGSVEHLNVLNLKDCENLASLPDSIYGMKDLIILNLSGCSKLEFNLEEFVHLGSLEELDVSRTTIRHLPSSFFKFKELKTLSFSGCKFHPLDSEREGSTVMSSSLHSLSGLCSLTELDFSNCNLQSIPSDIDCLFSLRSLNLSSNSFTSLPASISRLSKLGQLYLENCKRLQSVPELPSSMTFINAESCSSLEKLPEMLYLCSLRTPRSKFTNCSKMFDWNDKALAMLLRYLKGLSDPRTRFDIVVPGNEIPEWFYHQLPAVFFDTNWMGLAFCVTVTINDPLTFQAQNLDLACYVRIDDCFCTHLRARTYYLRTMDKVRSDHLWLFYLSRNELFNSDLEAAAKEFHHASVVFLQTSIFFHVRDYGVRVVYNHDLL